MEVKRMSSLVSQKVLSFRDIWTQIYFSDVYPSGTFSINTKMLGNLFSDRINACLENKAAISSDLVLVTFVASS